ncbi:hypothetical protein FCV25MIE_13329 [Fagus crenata]
MNTYTAPVLVEPSQQEAPRRSSRSFTTLAPRWVPKRGRVLRKVVKTIFLSCICAQEHATSRHSTNPSAIAPSKSFT